MAGGLGGAGMLNQHQDFYVLIFNRNCMPGRSLLPFGLQLGGGVQAEGALRCKGEPPHEVSYGRYPGIGAGKPIFPKENRKIPRDP
jgi:hypothetical protein